MHTFVTRYGRRWSMLTLALLVLIGVLPLSAQAAADDAQPRFYVDRYYSASLGKEMTYRVYLPDGYYNGNQRYPVVYMLHEEGQSSRQFEDDRLQDSLDQWIAEGTIQKMIVVMPDTSGDSWFVNQDGGRWEDLIASDLVPVIDQRYPTIALPAFRGISGVSMGGFGAFVLGMRHPELFGSIASHMGALDRTVGGLQPLALIKGKTAAALKAYQYYLDGGTDDPMTYATNSTNDIHAYFRANNVAHGYQSRPGGHDKAYYLTYLNRSFMMHSASFAKGLLSGSFAASPQAISVDDTKVNVSFTVNLNRTSVANAVYENRANSAFNLNVSLKVSDPGSNAALYTANTSLGNVVQNSSLSSFTGSFTVPVSALGSLKSTNLTLDAKILGTSFTLGTKPLIRVAPTGTLPEDQQIDLLGDWRFTKDTYPTASINGADESLDTSGWSVVQPGLDWWTDGFGGYAGLNNYYGAAWYVKKFDVPADFPMEDLTLMAGKIDDADMTYINGRLVGETGFSNGVYTSSFWAASREYAIPSDLLRRGGTNTIAVRMYNQNGGGGWYAGPIGIYTKAAAQKSQKSALAGAGR
ncbi:alpha/beta hydrolase-fold protein [Cohnella ginsengisoli]|uniref:Alpha/beta hydrolase-fold protein n=1 Tax=Cohnella ginsengisoli TaxID=425004 RepID=A0A9X4KFB9_9BACL|nr:alpha/beta hydrolase-fold protein [Cohnella ginsengisoli]MDG0791052.1 alpha/beta hydrolase-fold protein [Cohnella ginsengisoli]